MVLGLAAATVCYVIICHRLTLERAVVQRPEELQNAAPLPNTAPTILAALSDLNIPLELVSLIVPILKTLTGTLSTFRNDKEKLPNCGA